MYPGLVALAFVLVVPLLAGARHRGGGSACNQSGANQATSTIPIIMAYWGTVGLIESRVVGSFARPGGNVTGVYMLASELDAKRLQLLLKAVPKAKAIAVLDPGLGSALPSRNRSCCGRSG
jgi:putative ABC transport system substrate-binding protein